MAKKLKTYEIEINGVKHRVQLSDEDAATYKTAKLVTETKQSTPSNK